MSDFGRTRLDIFRVWSLAFSSGCDAASASFEHCRLGCRIQEYRNHPAVSGSTKRSGVACQP